MNEKARITPLTTEMAIKEWDTIEGVICKVLDQACGRYDMGHVKDLVTEGKALVLLVWDPEEKVIYAAMIAQADVYPLKKVFNLSICAGDSLEEWGHLYPVIKFIAKKLGYDQIDITGRPGWKKFIPSATNMATCFTEDL